MLLLLRHGSLIRLIVSVVRRLLLAIASWRLVAAADAIKERSAIVGGLRSCGTIGHRVGRREPVVGCWRRGCPSRRRCEVPAVVVIDLRRAVVKVIACVRVLLVLMPRRRRLRRKVMRVVLGLLESV